MTALYCWMIGGLFAISIYLLLSDQLMRWLIGVVILSSSINLVIFVAGRLHPIPAFVSDKETQLLSSFANPLSQALILTSIVIGFGLLVFALVLIRKVWREFKTLDTDQLCQSDCDQPERKLIS